MDSPKSIKDFKSGFLAKSGDLLTLPKAFVDTRLYFLSLRTDEDKVVKDSKPLIPEIMKGMRARRPVVCSGLIKESDRDSSYILPIATAGCDSDFKDPCLV